MTAVKYSIRISGLLISVLLIFIFYACQGNIKHEKRSNENLQDKINEFINDGPDFLEKTIEKSKDDIIYKLGNPTNVRETKVKNIHDPTVTDQIYELFYEGLYIRIYAAKSVDKSFIEHISITSDKYRSKWGLNVGVSKDYIKSILGNALKMENNIWTYIDSEGYKDDPYEDKVKFYFEDNTVYKIEWYFWID